jgi:hypothetical protein
MKNLVVVVIFLFSIINLTAKRYNKTYKKNINTSYHANKFLALNPTLEMTYAGVFKNNYS